MKYSAFRNKVKQYPLFRSNMFGHITDNIPILRRQLVEWVQKGYVWKLKRGVYTLNSEDRSVGLSRFFIANHLYSPSYISLESALSHYGFIPEQVRATTSVSTKKTQRFHNYYGDFLYYHIKTALYDDYIAEQDEYGNTFYIATRERSIIDFLYLKTSHIKHYDVNIFDVSFRWQNLSSVDKNKLVGIAQKFKQKKLSCLVDMLVNYTPAT